MKSLRHSYVLGLTLTALGVSAKGAEVMPAQSVPSQVTEVREPEKGTTNTIPGTSLDSVDSKRAEHLKYLENLDSRTAGFSPLERLAVRRDLNPPTSSEVAPFRFSGTRKLEQMLLDPAWVKHWWPIAVTIAMAADEKESHRLLEFIQSGDTVAGFEKQSLEARFAALGALHHVVVDQNVPAVISFLESLTHLDYAAGLAVSKGYSPLAVKKLAEDVLAKIGTDETIAILQASKSRAESEAGQNEVQTADGSSHYEIERLTSLIENAKRHQAGLPPAPLKDGDPIQ